MFTGTNLLVCLFLFFLSFNWDSSATPSLLKTQIQVKDFSNGNHLLITWCYLEENKKKYCWNTLTVQTSWLILFLRVLKSLITKKNDLLIVLAWQRKGFWLGCQEFFKRKDKYKKFYLRPAGDCKLKRRGRQEEVYLQVLFTQKKW